MQINNNNTELNNDADDLEWNACVNNTQEILILLRKLKFTKTNMLIELESKANAFMNSDLNNEAVSCLKEAVELEPKNQELLQYLAVCYHEIGMYPKAIENFQRVLDKNPQNCCALLNQGNNIKDSNRNE